MSVRQITRVFTESTSEGPARLMLLALADYANDMGECYPSVAGLASKCNLSHRRANYALAELRTLGEIEVGIQTGPNGKNRYRIVLGESGAHIPETLFPPLPEAAPPHSAGIGTPAGNGTLPVSVITPAGTGRPPLPEPAPEPSLNRQEPSEEKEKRGRARAKRTPPTTSPPKVKSSSKCPSDFVVSASMRAWAQSKAPSIDIDLETEQFRRHDFKCPHSDWLATWESWLLKAVGYAHQNGNGRKGKGALTPRQAEAARRKANLDFLTGRDRREQPDIIDIDARTLGEDT